MLRSLSATNLLRLAVIAACLAAYGGTIKAKEFIRDDRWLIADNPLLRRGISGVPALLTTGYVEAVEGKAAPIQEYRPLLTLSYLFHVLTTGFDPGPMHAGNVLVHAAVCLLFLEILRKRTSLVAAGAASLAFALMPIHTEAVSYITSRSELLSAALMLGAWLALEPDGAVAPTCRRSMGLQESRPGKTRMALGASLYGAAMLTKEHSLLFPAFLALSDWTFSGLSPWSRKRRGLYAVLLACAGLYLGLRLASLERVVHGGVPYFDGASRLIAALTYSRFFMAHYLAPSLTGLGLCADYSRPLIPDSGLASWGSWASLAALAALFGTAAHRLIRRRSPWAFWTLAPCLFLLPTSHLIIPLDTLGAERLVYFPTLGLAYLLGHLGKRRRARLILAGLLPWYLIRTWDRNRAWASELAFYEATLACNPVCAKIHSSLGAYWLAHGDARRGEAHLLKAVDLKPDLAHPRYNLGLAAWKRGDPAQAERLLREALRLSPASKDTLVLLAIIAESRGRLEEAERLLLRALDILPWDPAARFNLGRLYLLRREPREALPHLRKFLESAPNDPDATKVAELVRELSREADERETERQQPEKIE